MEKQLPKNWVECTLGDLLILKNGYAFKSSDYINEGIPIIRMSDIDNNEINLNKAVRVSDNNFLNQFIIEKGDILIGMSGSIGKYGIFNLNEKAYLNQRVGNLRLISEKHTNKKFIYYFIGQFQKEIIDKAYGGAVPNISGKQIEESLISLPPLKEQDRIVTKLDTLFAQLETIKTSMVNIPLLLKDFRQQVLTQAVAGKLTEEWRKGKKLKVWENVELNKVIPKGGIFDGPFGSNLKTEDYTDQGVRVIRLENIEHLDFIENKETYVSYEKHQKLIRHTVCEGDIIFSSFISEDIRACILPKLKTKAIAKADCFCIRPDVTIIDKKFLLYILVSNTTYSQLTSHIHGATRPRINTTQLKTITIPLVSLKEQQEIVSRVESLFAKADAIEQQYKALKASIDTLPQAILHKAFKGELSEQLESDGDAKELLEEIKALKYATGKVIKSKTQISKAKKVKNYPEEDGVLDMVAEGK